MKCCSIVRHLILFSLTVILFWFIYLSFMKLLDEDTKARNYYQEDGAELPSMTICLKWLNKSVPNTRPFNVYRDLALPDTSNWNFEDYRKKAYMVDNIFSKAAVFSQPHDKEPLYERH